MHASLGDGSINLNLGRQVEQRTGVDRMNDQYAMVKRCGGCISPVDLRNGYCATRCYCRRCTSPLDVPRGSASRDHQWGCRSSMESVELGTWLRSLCERHVVINRKQSIGRPTDLPRATTNTVISGRGIDRHIATAMI